MSDEFDSGGNLVYGRSRRHNRKKTHQEPHDPHAEERRLRGLLLLGVHDKRCNKNFSGECNCGLEEAQKAAAAK